MDEKLNKYAFWCWFSGFLLAFMPLYMLGFMGATRRLNHYDASTGWHPLFVLAAVGALIIFFGACIQVYGLYSTLKNRSKHRDRTGDPWNGRTLEWSTASPPPIYNFAIIPTVNQLDPVWAMKRDEAPRPVCHYEDIHLPINTAIPLYMGILALIFGFAMTWHIGWLSIVSFIGIVVLLILRLSGHDEHDVITVAEVKKMEAAHGRGSYG